MAFFVEEGRDSDAHRRGVKMGQFSNDVKNTGGKVVVPKEGQHDYIINLHAGIMEKCAPSLMHRTLTTSDPPHKGKKMNADGRDAVEGREPANLFYPYGKDAPPVKRPFQVRDPSEGELRSLMSSGAQHDREQQIHKIEDSPSRFDRQIQQGTLMPFYKESSAKREQATENAIQKGFGTKNHSLLQEIMRSDDLPGMQKGGKRVQKHPSASSSATTTPSVSGFKGLGSSPGNIDPFADKRPQKVVRDYSWDPLKLAERGAAPHRKPVDDLRPHHGALHQSPLRARDGIQTRALLGNPSYASVNHHLHGHKPDPPTLTELPREQQQYLSQKPHFVADPAEEAAEGQAHVQHQEQVVALARTAPAVVGVSHVPKQHPPPIVARVDEDAPRSTKHYSHINVGVGQGPDLIPGFQGLGAVNVNTHELMNEIPVHHQGTKKLRPVEHITHHQYPGPNSTTKRLAQGEKGDGGTWILGGGGKGSSGMSFPPSSNSVYGAGTSGLGTRRAHSSLLP